MEKKRIIIFAIIVLAILIMVFLPGFSELQKEKEENEQLERRIALLEEHNEQLKGELYKMKNDPSYVEQRARKKLGVIKKGERIYRPGSPEGK